MRVLNACEVDEVSAPAISDVFAANRADSRIALTVAARDGVTRRAQVAECGALRVRFPNRAGAELEAVLVNTGGGMTGGDRFQFDIAAGPDTQLLVTTTAAEKVYRSLGPVTEVAVNIRVAAGARLRWLPQETILFDRARLSRRIDVDLEEGASALLAEAVVFGRAAMGEAVCDGLFADRWRVRVGGRLIHAEAAWLDGGIAAKLTRTASAAGGIALATLAIIPGGGADVDAVRAAATTCTGEVGISAWNGIAVARFCAPDSQMLRHDLTAALRALGHSLPKLWKT